MKKWRESLNSKDECRLLPLSSFEKWLESLNRSSTSRAASVRSSASTASSRRTSLPNRANKWTHSQMEWEDVIPDNYEDKKNDDGDGQEDQGEEYTYDEPNDAEGEEA